MLHAGYMKAYPLTDDLLRPLHRVAMPRAPRVVAPADTIHVVTRCNNRAFCFTTAQDFAVLRAHLREMAHASEMLVQNWCRAPNRG